MGERMKGKILHVTGAMNVGGTETMLINLYKRKGLIPSSVGIAQCAGKCTGDCKSTGQGKCTTDRQSG